MAEEFELPQDSSASEAEGSYSSDQDSEGQGHDGRSSSQQNHPVRDYTEDFEYLKKSNERIAQANEKLLRDVSAHKEELANMREAERRRTLLFAGDKSIIQEETRKRRAEEIKNEFYELFPKARDMFEGNAQAFNQQPQPSVAEMAYMNSAKQEAYTFAKNEGFSTPEGQHFMAVLGDVLIHSVPDWKARFYQGGDRSVLNEVTEFIREKIFKPRDQQIESRLLEKIKKQGRYVSPLPRTSAGSGRIEKPKDNLDFTKPEDRHKRLSEVIQRSISSLE